MFNFKRAASALLTLLIFTGIIAGAATLVIGLIDANATELIAGAIILILSLSAAAGLTE